MSRRNPYTPSRSERWALAVAVSKVRHGDNPANWSIKVRKDFPNEYLEYSAWYNYINT